MLGKDLFKKPGNSLEGGAKFNKKTAGNIPEEMCSNCPACGKTLFSNDLPSSFFVCPACGHHFRINARQRVHFVADRGSFSERDKTMESVNLLQFPDYENKLTNAQLVSAEKEGVVCGVCKIGGYPAALFVMEPSFMMGSMGTVVGEKITRLFEYAAENGLPVIGFTVSGGARMQEGMLSLVQMAKVSGAVGLHSQKGLLYVTVLTDPTTGGVTASFAMEGDIIIAEPNALIGFAGARVIEQTIRQKLPPGFQRAEFLIEKGFIDSIVDRRRQKSYLTKLLMLHTKEAEHDGL